MTSPGPLTEKVVDSLLGFLADESPQGPSAFLFHGRRLIQVGEVTGARTEIEWLLSPSGERTLLFLLPSGLDLAVLQYTASALDWKEALPLFETSAMATEGLAPNTGSRAGYLGWRAGYFIRKIFQGG